MIAVSFGCVRVCVWGCVVFVVRDAHRVLILGSSYTAHKRIVNILKVYITRNNIQVDLMAQNGATSLTIFRHRPILCGTCSK